MTQDDENKALVALKFELGEENEQNPFYVKATEESEFKWECGLEEDKVKRLLNQNASALLLFYLRPVVTQITSASQYGAYDIPFIDFTSNK